MNYRKLALITAFLLAAIVALAGCSSSESGNKVSTGGGSVKSSECISCHEKETPGVVKQYLEGKMSKEGVGCETCHGSKHKSMDDAKLAEMPTPKTCQGCHSEQVAQFNESKHNLAWIAASAMPMWSHQPKAVVGEGYKGCSSCHKVGAKPEEEQAQYRYGNAQCDACHTRCHQRL